ncbi:MAG: DNA-processing protein DprA [Candidatus Rifleibacteriota bacterium]
MADSKSQAEKLAWLRLAGMPWLGATIKAGLIKTFRDPLKIFSASKTDLAQVPGWDNRRLERFLKHSHEEKPVCSLEMLETKDIQMVCYNDKAYPQLLREIPDSPVVLFCKGSPDLAGRPAIAVVGARNGTQMGYDIAKEFTYVLSRAGFIVVSGLALGIDTYAHRGAIEAGGRTFAVLGSGLDVVYPKGNVKVRESILKHGGALISEYPPGVIARPWHFPVRNRIISGMCIATLVVEASARSGSLITARLAAEQNREVFAVPGSIRSSVSEGTLNLIQEGANLVTEPDEIIDYFSHLLPNTPRKTHEHYDEDELNADEKKLLQDLSAEPLSIDLLLEKYSWKREKLFSLLLTLEMREYLIRLPGNCYQAKKKLSREGSCQ